MQFEQSLLDIMAEFMEFDYVSDLRFLSPGQRRFLYQRIKVLPLREEDIKDWNDALEYIAGALPQRTAESAREHLLGFLNR